MKRISERISFSFCNANMKDIENQCDLRKIIARIILQKNWAKKLSVSE